MSIINTLAKPPQAKGIVSHQFTPNQVCAAMRTVITFTITDVFDLTPEETLWLSYHMGTILEPFEASKPKAIPVPVMHELMTRQYSSSLSTREQGQYAHKESEIEDTRLSDWVEIIMEMVTSSYQPIRPLVEASVRGQISGVLTELGVGIEKSPRGALYLPNAVRFNLARRDSED